MSPARKDALQVALGVMLVCLVYAAIVAAIWNALDII